MTELYVKVRPGEGFSIEMKDFPVIGLDSEAEQGKANSELLRRLESIVGERPVIVSGHKSRRKKLKVDMSKQRFEQRLRNHDG